MAKNRINLSATVEMMRDGYGLDPKIFNFYQLGIRAEESANVCDWYHTTGALVVCQDGYFSRMGTFRNPELAAHAISKHALR